MPNKHPRVSRPQQQHDFIVLRGFNYIPKGETEERRVEAGAQLPQDLTAVQVTRLVERGVAGQREATQEVTDG